MFELSAQDAGDIAVTAAEGGTGYWGQIQSYEWKRWDGKNDLPDDFMFYNMAEYEAYGVGWSFIEGQVRIYAK